MIICNYPRIYHLPFILRDFLPELNEESLETLGVNPDHGLSQSQVEINRKKFARNRLKDPGRSARGLCCGKASNRS
jgi:hypothetical protein